jgi:Domain of unknown function (DUF222)/HNH endonuclease
MSTTDLELLRTADEAVVEMAAANARLLRVIPDIDERGLWQSDGATCMTHWLGFRYCVTHATAREWVRVANALRSLTAIAAAYEAGRLSWDQLRPLTKFATAETDEHWAREAPSWRAAELWIESKRYEQLRERVSAEAHRDRYLRIDWNEEKTEMYLQARFAAEQGSEIERAVVKRAEEVVVADDPYDRRGARDADALHELVAGGAGDAPHSTLVVHADAAVLTGEPDTGLSEAEDGTGLGAEQVRRIACDARIEWILERDGRPVGIGRRGRAIPGAMMRALRFRDRGCRFPGCGRIRWIKAHHLVHWARGGGTDLDNLVLLCHAHHRLIHEGGWRTSGHPGRNLRFHDPTGRMLRALHEDLPRPEVAAFG